MRTLRVLDGRRAATLREKVGKNKGKQATKYQALPSVRQTPGMRGAEDNSEHICGRVLHHLRMFLIVRD